MAQQHRQSHDEAPPPSPCSFTSLPDIAHGTIASFLPDGNTMTGNRLRVSEVSRALLMAYGGTLTLAHLRNIKYDSAARLAALLRRQHRLKAVYVLRELFPWPSPTAAAEVSIRLT
jgi:hypothetical protein